MAPAAGAEKAPAKVNLTLRVIGRRADGYHDIESLVAFADVGDALTFTPGGALALSVGGPTAAAAGEIADNLVLKAARATGADVPVCLDPRPRFMRGIGDLLSGPLDLPRLFAVLLNPAVAVATKDVFAALAIPTAGQTAPATICTGATALLAEIAGGRNDLEGPAIELEPAIADALAVLRKLPGCRLARMSGSGATCFGLFDSIDAARGAARRLRVGYPAWWVRATALGG
jgi:4-diphosphocytidyl-2-C-methyl-D-erythritol kinase